MRDTVTIVHEYDEIAQVTNEVAYVTIVEEGRAGEQGPQGDTGPQGPQGNPGVGSDKNYVHTQIAALATWAIAHNLAKFPSVMVVDSADSVVVGEIVYLDTNNLTVTFSGAFGGKAYLN